MPLALRLAAGALAERRDLSPTDYLRRLSDAQQRLKLLDKVEASLGLSYDLLDPEAQNLWRTLAVFPDTFDLRAAAALWETEADAAQDALGELLKLSMLEWDDTTARYSLHDLARLFADSRLSEEERSAAQMRHAAHYMSVLREANNLYLQGGEAVKRGLALFNLEWRNIHAGQSWAEKQSGENDAAASLCNDHPDAGAYLLDLRQHPREQIRWREAALAAARRLKNRGAEGRHLCGLGLAYYGLGEYRRAVKLYEQALAISREIGNRQREGQDLGNLGLAYADLGETRRAVEFHEQCFAIAREIGDRRGEGQALGNMGMAYAELGETRRAIELHEQDLVIAREIGDRRRGRRKLGNLGLAYAELGETRRAIEFFEQRLAIAREVGDRRGEATRFSIPALRSTNWATAHRLSPTPRRRLRFMSRSSRRMPQRRAQH